MSQGRGIRTGSSSPGPGPQFARVVNGPKTGERLSNRRGIRTIPSILLSNRSPVAAALKGLPAEGN
ncbi:GD18780 [Drosophila simulans]|uniref:GD18780 n=1 Tax=Drosophila simulans TaxID=7240 RepID=B4QTM0_DROSI|nr:GD18780 [Drosophila simulans]